MVYNICIYFHPAGSMNNRFNILMRSEIEIFKVSKQRICLPLLQTNFHFNKNFIKKESYWFTISVFSSPISRFDELNICLNILMRNKIEKFKIYKERVEPVIDIVSERIINDLDLVFHLGVHLSRLIVLC